MSSLPLLYLLKNLFNTRMQISKPLQCPGLTCLPLGEHE